MKYCIWDVIFVKMLPSRKKLSDILNSKKLVNMCG